MIGAADGKEGLGLVTKTTPGLILLDMMLLGVTGLQCALQAKAKPITKQIPVIVSSGRPQNRVAKLREEGAAAYIEKSETFDNNLTFLIHPIKVSG